MRPVDQDLAELRLKAERALREDQRDVLLGLRHELQRRDAAWWPHLWLPGMAIGMAKTGRDGWPDLVATVNTGFRQPELLPLAEVFESHDEWDTLRPRMSESAPADSWSLDHWPIVDYAPPLVLDMITADRADDLRSRLPVAPSVAWETAVRVLDWTTSRWDHSNYHVDDGDAIDVLDGVTHEHRFGCVEYSIHTDLSQLETTIVETPDGPGLSFCSNPPVRQRNSRRIHRSRHRRSSGVRASLCDVQNSSVTTVTPYGTLHAHELTLVSGSTTP